MYWMLSGRVMCAISLFEPIFAWRINVFSDDHPRPAVVGIDGLPVTVDAALWAIDEAINPRKENPHNPGTEVLPPDARRPEACRWLQRTGPSADSSRRRPPIHRIPTRASNRRTHGTASTRALSSASHFFP